MRPGVNIVLAVVAGFVSGSLVNIGIVNAGPSLIPLPEGADVSTMEGLRSSMQLFTPVNFLAPFLAHALGTLTGSFVAAKVATSHRVTCAMGVSACFLLGGISAVATLGGPLWFAAADLLLAYLPMGYLGARLAGATKPPSA
ncbi:MAG: hypothetical protein IPF98_11390 [Gemmatimonadetes bacterium]|nr:hypothetical protein [Gemmatimonadota bacterium]